MLRRNNWVRTINYSNSPYFAPLARHEIGLLNGFDRTLEQLLVLQDRRRAREREATVELIAPPANDDAP
jgi:hypothetical protein